MLVLSRRAEIEDSLTLKINSDVIELIKKGENIIPLVAGEPDFETEESIKQAAIEAINNNFTHYTNSAGILQLREKIAEKLEKENNIKYSPDQIIVSVGAKQSIANAILSLIDEGDDVLIPAPYWVSYKAMVEISGGNPVFIPTTWDLNFKLTPELLKDYIGPKSKVLILNSPANPTGVVYSMEELEKLGKIILEHDLYVISDEIYEKLIFDNKQHISIASLGKELYQRTVVVNGFSKAFSMTGWRIGYSAGPKNIMKIIKKIQANTTSHTSSISQYAALKALELDQSYFKMIVATFQERRNYIFNKLKNCKNLRIYCPDGAFYFFIDFSPVFGKYFKNKEITCDIDLYKILLEYAKVALVPGSAFGNKNCLRLSFSYSLETIKEGINRILEVLSQIK